MIKKILLSLLALVVIAIVSIVSIANHHQKKNITKLLSLNLDGRLIPHKANYTNKLKNILNDDLLSFEFDTVFNDKVQTPFFEVGHDKKEINGTSFEDYLKLTKDEKIKKIWMDIKNLNENNIDKILTRLNYLNKKYNIKNILLFETSSTSPVVRVISDAGYHTSYYLPYTTLELISNKNDIAIKNEALRIKKQIKNQNFKAISFASSLYPFVKSYVEPIISKEIVYHTWEFFRMRKVGELSRIQKNTFYKDERIKTIIYTYYNNKFNRLYSF